VLHSSQRIIEGKYVSPCVETPNPVLILQRTFTFLGLCVSCCVRSSDGKFTGEVDVDVTLYTSNQRMPGSKRCRNTGLPECFSCLPKVPVENSVIHQSPTTRRFKALDSDSVLKNFIKECSFNLKYPTPGVTYSVLYIKYGTDD
jgi:hypothetical protein